MVSSFCCIPWAILAGVFGFVATFCCISQSVSLASSVSVSWGVFGFDATFWPM